MSECRAAKEGKGRLVEDVLLDGVGGWVLAAAAETSEDWSDDSTWAASAAGAMPGNGCCCIRASCLLCRCQSTRECPCDTACTTTLSSRLNTAQRGEGRAGWWKRCCWMVPGGRRMRRLPRAQRIGLTILLGQCPQPGPCQEMV
jgi:hypothetical protein